jgi:cell wall-associated NlpC family hydrolase
MKDAIAQIKADFQSNINARVDAIKATESFDDVKVEYAGDMDGDSDTVNNWSDVLSVYAAATMYEGFKFLTITPENIGTLRDIYNEMNQLEFRTEKTTGFAAGEDPSAPPVPVTTLNVYVSVNSLTYEEGAKMHIFDRKQMALLDRLMSPSYYTYFADLLGVDVYDGTESEELQQIIAGLPQGTKGAAIVQAALIRIGHPYSKSKRGSGNYVDCSYFVYWSYNQAGITIPTSSVEQARYCNNNGYVVDKEDLKPGDIVFWAKTGCSCGRWREIHHAARYIGNNKTIEASSSKGRVIIRDLWSGGGWKIAMYARPYTEDTVPADAGQPTQEVQQ